MENIKEIKQLYDNLCLSFDCCIETKMRYKGQIEMFEFLLEKINKLEKHDPDYRGCIEYMPVKEKGEYFLIEDVLNIFDE